MSATILAGIQLIRLIAELIADEQKGNLTEAELAARWEGVASEVKAASQLWRSTSPPADGS